jgi:hypothetical protein
MRTERWLCFAFIASSTAIFGGCSSSSSSDNAANATSSTNADEQEAGCAVEAGPLDPSAVSRGAGLVVQWKCGSCHQGDAGTLGGGTLGLDGGAPAYPPNLTPDLETGLGCWTDSQIESAMVSGVDNGGVQLCVMPQFEFDPGTAHDIIAYLRSLPAVSNQVPDTNCP